MHELMTDKYDVFDDQLGEIEADHKLNIFYYIHVYKACITSLLQIAMACQNQTPNLPKIQKVALILQKISPTITKNTRK